MTDITKRKLNRYAISLPIRITIADDPSTSAAADYDTSDLSAGGAFIDTETPLPIGAEVEIDLTIPLEDMVRMTGPKALVKVTGEVIRVNERGMAIRFGDRYEIRPIH